MTAEQQLQKIQTADGFIAALDQSGGSTPKALRLYGIDESEYSGADEMLDLIHQMRTRIITSPSFGGDRILGAILFEDTMDRQIGGKQTAQFLWEDKQVVPFIKVDKGLAEEQDGVQLMKPIPDLYALLERAKKNGIFGTKMRSFIKMASPKGVKAVVDQQFEIARRILAADLIPIIEPEIDIHSPQKAEAEALLKAAILEHLNKLAPDQLVMLKLTLPDEDNFYAECIDHRNVLKVVALSGGYTRKDPGAQHDAAGFACVRVADRPGAPICAVSCWRAVRLLERERHVVGVRRRSRRGFRPTRSRIARCLRCIASLFEKQRPNPVSISRSYVG